jgi:hypothetical protein
MKTHTEFKRAYLIVAGLNDHFEYAWADAMQTGQGLDPWPPTGLRSAIQFMHATYLLLAVNDWRGTTQSSELRRTFRRQSRWKATQGPVAGGAVALLEKMVTQARGEPH